MASRAAQPIKLHIAASLASSHWLRPVDVDLTTLPQPRSRQRANPSFVVITGVSALVAWVLSKIFKLKRSQTAFAICAAMFQNSNSLPIALVQSLVGVVPGLKWGKGDTKDAMLGRALTYMVLYSTLGMVLRWSYGVKLLANADDDEEHALPLASEPESHGSQTVVVASPVATTGQAISVLSPEPIHREDPFNSLEALAASNRASVSGPFAIVGARGRAMSGDSEPRPSSLPISPSPLGRSPRTFSPAGPRQRRGSALSRSSSRSRPLPSRTDSGRDFWNLPAEQPRRHELVDLAEDSSESEAEDADEWGGPEMPLLRRRLSPSAPFLNRAAVRARAMALSAWESFYAFMTVPTWAALISIIIALIPPLQRFVSSIHPFVAAVKSAGACSIPVTLVVLGAFFYTPPQPIQLPDEIDRTLKGYIERKIRSLKSREKSSAYEGENRAVFVAVVSRMILVPLLFLPIIAYIARTDPFPAAADPVFILCSVLLVSSPPALTLAQLTQAASGDAFERLISKTISWSYAVLTPPLTIAYVVIGLVFSKL
jgi:predicted permease